MPGECGGEGGGLRKKREQEKRKKLQEGPPWVGFSPKKVLSPEKAIWCRDPLGWLHHCLFFQRRQSSLEMSVSSGPFRVTCRSVSRESGGESSSQGF